MKSKDQNCLATKGLVGWHVRGRSGHNCTFSSGPYNEPPKDCIAIDMSEVYEAKGIGVSAEMIWKTASLDLSLPDDNVRNLFEGCIGNEGTTDGHPWDGDLSSIKGMDSVGLNVYVEILKSQGGKIVQLPII